MRKSYRGTVSYVSYSEWETYSFALRGRQGWFRLGKDLRGVAVGAFVEFEADEKSRVHNLRIFEGDPELRDCPHFKPALRVVANNTCLVHKVKRR